MRYLLVILPLILATQAAAQVSTDTQSLDKLAPTAPPPKAPPAAAAKPAARHARRAVPPRRTLPVVGMPAVPPANPVIKPAPFVIPEHKAPPPPPVPIVAGAWGDATPIPGGTRITFGKNSSDLNPATLAALRVIAAQASATPTLLIAVTAWAPGTPDDASTARRLSLDRALAARAVLINAGILSDRIRVVAKGLADVGSAAADRADITVMK